MTVTKFVLTLSLALALASCASSPESSPPESSAPNAPTARDSAEVLVFTPPFNFTGEQNNPFTLSNWDMTDPQSPARMHYQRYPSFSRYYYYYALSSAIACLLTSLTFGVLMLMGYL